MYDLHHIYTHLSCYHCVAKPLIASSASLTTQVALVLALAWMFLHSLMLCPAVQLQPVCCTMPHVVLDHAAYISQQSSPHAACRV